MILKANIDVEITITEELGQMLLNLQENEFEIRGDSTSDLLVEQLIRVYVPKLEAVKNWQV